MNKYGLKLKSIREAFRLTQKDFSKALDLKQSAYCMIENGVNGTSLALVEILFNQFNVSPTWFFNDEGEMFNTGLVTTSYSNNIQSQLTQISLAGASEASTAIIDAVAIAAVLNKAIHRVHVETELPNDAISDLLKLCRHWITAVELNAFIDHKSGDRNTKIFI